MTMRVLPNSAGCSTDLGGQTYAAQPGSYLDVAKPVGEALLCSGWIAPGPMRRSGPTASRPNFSGVPAQDAGYTYLDTDLGYVVVWDGAAWRNPATAASV